MWEQVRIKKQLAAQVKALAKKDGRSFASMVAHILKLYVERGSK